MKHARNDGPDMAFRLARRLVATVADDMSTPQRVVAGIVAALVGISPFGAWSEVEAQADPLVAGMPVEVGPFEVTVVKAATADELSYIVPEPGNHLLAVVADVTNTSDVPEYGVTLTGAIPAPEDVGIVPETPLDELGADLGTDLGAEADAGDASDGDADPSADPSASADPEEPAEPKLPSATVLRVEDATSVSIFNPGVTHRVALIWEQSGDWSGGSIALDILELEWIDESAVSLDNSYWLTGETAAFHGEIPVDTDQPEAGTSDEAGQA